ncbi:hypothetical protein D3C71_1712920 [compost metagenome]
MCSLLRKNPEKSCRISEILLIPVLCGQNHRRFIPLRYDERGVGLALYAENPFGIIRHRQLSYLRRGVCYVQPHDLDRVLFGNKHGHSMPNSSTLVFKSRIAMAVRDEIRRDVFSGCWSDRPRLTRFLIP